MPKKPVGILKRNAYTPKPADGTRRKRRLSSQTASLLTTEIPQSSSVSKQEPKQVQQEPQQQPFWTCQSEVDRQAAACLSKILASDANKRNGKTIKSLTLAPHIKAKKAVYAVTCQTLQCKLFTSIRMILVLHLLRYGLSDKRMTEHFHCGRSPHHPTDPQQDNLAEYRAITTCCGLCHYL